VKKMKVDAAPGQDIFVESVSPMASDRPFPLDAMGLADGGERTTYETGALREPATGKGRYDLIPPASLRRLAQHYERGAAKYSPRNWEKGIPCSRCFDSAARHLQSYLEGSRDEDHLAAVAWNVFAIMYFESKGMMLDLPGQK